MQRSALAVFLTLAAVGHAQTTRVVPTQFGRIDLAIAASAPGDTIEVLPGNYGTFWLDKGLTIVGRDVRILGGFLVAGVPAGQSARITGIDPDTFHALPTRGIDVRDCAGEVHISDLQSPLRGEASTITNCAFVSLNRCNFIGVSLGPTIRTSFVQISGCTSIAGSAALVCSDSDVRVSASSFESRPSLPLLPPSNAIQLESGTLVLGAGSTVTAGTGAGIASAIVSDGALGLDPGVVLTPSGAPAIAGSGTTTILGAPSAVIDEFSTSGDFAGRAIAPAGVACGILLGLPAPPIPTPFGPFELGGFALAIDAGVVPATGARSFRFPVAAATPVGVTLSIQAFVNDGTNIYLSTSSTAVLGL